MFCTFILKSRVLECFQLVLKSFYFLSGMEFSFNIRYMFLILLPTSTCDTKQKQVLRLPTSLQTIVCTLFLLMPIPLQSVGDLVLACVALSQSLGFCLSTADRTWFIISRFFSVAKEFEPLLNSTSTHGFCSVHMH